MRINLRHIAVFCLFLLVTSGNLTAQKLEEKVYKSGIKTVQVRKKADSLAPPVIGLNSGNQVVLSFDELKSGQQSYSYKLVHCNAQWEPSELMEHEYLYSQFNSEIQFSKNSFNTIIPYTHYRELIPNDRIEPSISGNYAIVVYEYNSPEDTVLVAHFRMTENKASVQAQVERINRMSPSKPNQQLTFSIDTRSLLISNPYQNIKAIVKQNGHNTRMINKVSPSTMQGNTLKYQNLDALKFKGGNEFWSFNSKSVEFASQNIEKIDFLRNKFHFRLTPDNSRKRKEYQIEKELNGKYQVDKERSTEPHLEADYVYVYFTLKDKTPEMTGGKVFVTGGFNNWQHTEEAEMEYNFDQKAYENRLLLKQGYYSYKYELVNDQGVQETFYSGNHAKTENEYEIYVYFEDVSKGYDRLIGHTLYNTSNIDY